MIRIQVGYSALSACQRSADYLFESPHDGSAFETRDTMSIAFGIGLGGAPRFLNPADAALLSEIARIADDGGITAIGTHDTSFLGGDAFLRATLIARSTAIARVGLRPTNPVTREPSVMASFAAALDALTSGRAFLDIATGDSSVKSVGKRPASRAHLEEYVTCVQELLRHGESSYQGRVQRVQWSAEVDHDRIPISLCAEGPKMLHLAGRIAAGAICGTGLLAEVVADTRERVAAGARAAGRDPSSVAVWSYAVSSMAASPRQDDADRAEAILLPQLASILHHSLAGDMTAKQIPENLHARLRTYHECYALGDHSSAKAMNSNVRRMIDLGLADYARARFAIAGTIDEWVARIGELAEAGVERLWVNLGRGSLERQRAAVRAFVREVVPAFGR
jgi:5,10-methylenetetrahydromethanopterin reductase